MASNETPRSKTQAPDLSWRRALPPFETLRAFDAVARFGGVRKAAEYLCRDHAVVSRHLRTIEIWTGTKLIKRTAAGTVLTDEGARYHRSIASALDIIARATMDLIKQGDDRCLQIRCMPGFALHWLSPRLGKFEKANPDLEVDMQPANRSAEFLSPDSDVEIRFTGSYRPPMQLPVHLSSMEITRAPIIAVANRAYLASAEKIREPRDLLTQHLLHEEDSDNWHRWLSAHGVTDEGQLHGPRLWQGHLTLEGARSGRGIALTNMLIAGDDIRSGRLVEIGHQQSSFMPRSDGAYHFIARSDRWNSRSIEKFRNWLVNTIAQEQAAIAN